jgi:Flp pilus assembly protein TadG
MRIALDLLSRLLRETRGSVAITGALVTLPVLVCVGLAVDYAQMIRARAALQDAVDAATLAGAQVLTGVGDDAARAATQKYFDATAIAKSGAVISNIKVEGKDSEVSARADLNYRPSFMRVIGRDNVAIGAKSTSVGGLGSEVEIAVMLDLSSSMSGQRFSDLKTAARRFTNMIMDAKGASTEARIAFVPFASGVNPGALNAASKDPLALVANDCVDYRRGSDATTDARPQAGAYFDNLPSQPNWPCLTTPVLPLEGDRSRLLKFVDDLVLSEGTAGHIGAAWTWYMLSPNWASLLPSASVPKPYNSPFHRKVAVLFTDGENFPTVSGPAPLSDSASDANMIEQCKGMRARGITVYSVGFHVDATRALDTLRACASSPDFHYVAYSGAELERVFDLVAKSLMRLRLKS